MTRLVITAVVHFYSGEKSTIALLEDEKKFIIASDFQGKDDKGFYTWNGNGGYMFKTDTDAISALNAFLNRLKHEEDSIFTKEISF